MKLTDYGISEDRYIELRSICRQYDADRASPRADKRARAEAVRAAAEAADPALCVYILRNVTRRVRYEEMPVPCGINQFFRARRRFFVELDQRVP